MSRPEERPGTTVASRWLVAGLAALLIMAPTSPAAAQSLADGQWWHTQWEMDEVWRVSDGEGVTVAVLDSGMDPSVPELAGALVPGLNLSSAELDGVDHGTKMATLIAGRGGDRGFRGVAPAAKVLPIVASDGGFTRDEGAPTIAEGIRYAVDNAAQVVNISQAGPSVVGDVCPAQIADAVRYAADHDVIVVAGTGNNPGGESPYPGNCPGVLTVGATDRDLSPWPDSHRSEHVEVAAAGVDISGIGGGGQELIGSGTSNATALVSGAIALVRAEFPDASADQVLRRIIATAGDIHTPGRDDATGYGIVQPIHALTEPLPPDAPNPVYEQLDSATGSLDRSPGQLQTGGPPLTENAPDRDGGIDRALTIGVVGVFATLVIVGLVLALTVGRRRRPAQPRAYPYPPPPPSPPPRDRHRWE